MCICMRTYRLLFANKEVNKRVEKQINIRIISASKHVRPAFGIKQIWFLQCSTKVKQKLSKVQLICVQTNAKAMYI